MPKTPSAAAPKPAKPSPEQLARLERAREIVREIVGEGGSLVDELLAERRAAAAHE